jgi:hypothetical protein
MLNLTLFGPFFSLLMTLLSKLTLGGALNTRALQWNLHPVASGWLFGLIVTAFNLIAVGTMI